MNNDEASRAICDSAVGIHSEALIRALRPSARIRTKRIDSEADHRSSKFGGIPLAPRAFEWPQWDATLWLESQIRFYEQRKKMPWAEDAISRYRKQLAKPEFPLTFLAQVNLSEIDSTTSALGLPTTGWLLFFYDLANSGWGFDPASRGSAQVLYVDDGESLQVTQTPEGVDKHHTSRPCALQFEIEQTLPRDLCQYWITPSTFDGDRYKSLVRMLVDPEGAIHRLGGFPELIQKPMEIQCQLVTNGLYCGDSSGYKDPRAEALADGAADWRLLLQLDSDSAPGWTWGDGGRLYYWIREEDLRSRSFENAWCISQCY